MTIMDRAKWLPVLAAGLAASGCMTAGTAGRDTSNPITAGPVAGRCYPGGCSWFDIRSFEMVRETERGALLRLDTREGGSNHAMSADAPQSSRGVRIAWGPYSNDAYVFCSRELPAVITRAQDGSYEVLRLDLISGGVPEEFLRTQYGHVCHQVGELDGDGAVERLGYRPLRDGEEREFTLRSPEAIFDRLGR
jgi:hypothetical protein